MKYISIICLFASAMSFLTGCDMRFPASSLPGEKPVHNTRPYVAANIHIMGLTEIVPGQRTGEEAILKVYIDLMDSFDCRMKSPGVFRLELYEFVPRSSDPRGRRLFIQPDLDLTDPVDNDKYWQDHLRTYRFNLPLDFVPLPGSAFIIEATFIPPGGKRLNDKFHLKYQ
jgi:hypothetical protein